MLPRDLSEAFVGRPPLCGPSVLERWKGAIAAEAADGPWTGQKVVSSNL